MRELSSILREVGKRYELIFVDDGSRDGTFKLLAQLQAADDKVHVIRLRRNFGQTGALAAGFDFAEGDVIIAMDGDLQHSPEDIPVLLNKMAEGYDVVSGWREKTRRQFIPKACSIPRCQLLDGAAIEAAAPRFRNHL